MSLRRLYGPLVRILCVAGGLVALSATLALGTAPEDVVQVSENGNSDYPARRAVTAVTASGQQLVVWQQEDYGKSELWGRVVDKNGVVLGEPFPVSRPHTYSLNPAVAVRGRRNEFLVAWEEWFADGGVNGRRVVVRRFGGNGSPLDEGFVLANGGKEPALAYGGRRKEFVVVWSGSERGHVAEVHGARLPAGTTSTPEPFRIARGDSTDFYFTNASLAFDSRTGRYLVGWEEVYTRAEFTITESDAFVRTLPADPGERLGRIHRLSRSKEDPSGYPNLIYNRKKREYLALFSGTHLRRVNAEGRPYGRELAEGYRRDTGVHNVRLEDVNARPQGGYVVLFEGRYVIEGDPNLYARRVSSKLELRNGTELVAEKAVGYDGSLAYSREQARTRAMWLQVTSDVPRDGSGYIGWEIWTKGL